MFADLDIKMNLKVNLHFKLTQLAKSLPKVRLPNQNTKMGRRKNAGHTWQQVTGKLVQDLGDQNIENKLKTLFISFFRSHSHSRIQNKLDIKAANNDNTYKQKTKKEVNSWTIL